MNLSIKNRAAENKTETQGSTPSSSWYEPHSIANFSLHIIQLYVPISSCLRDSLQLQHSTNLNIQRSQSTHRFNGGAPGASTSGVIGPANNRHPLDVDDLEAISTDQSLALCDEVFSAIDLNMAANAEENTGSFKVSELENENIIYSSLFQKPTTFNKVILQHNKHF